MDEKGDVGPVSSSVSESAVSVTVPKGDETLKENLGSEGKGEGSYNEGEEEEIMVEVVGSDVFVDGVGGHEEGLVKEELGREMESCHSEGDFGSRQVGDLGGEECDNRTETGVEDVQMAVSSGERVEHVFEMDKVEVVTGSLSEQTNVVSVEKVEVRVSEQMIVEQGGVIENMLRDGESFDGGNGDLGRLTAEGVGVSDGEAWNPGIESLNVSSSLIPEPTSVHTPCVGDEADVAVRQEDFSGRDEAVRDGAANANLPLSGEDQSSVIETVSEATDKDSVTHAHSESSDNPAEAAAIMQVEGAMENVFRDGESFVGGNGDLGSLTAERIGVSDNEAWNPGIESVNVCSSLIPEPTSAHTPCVGDKADGAVRKEDFSGRDEALCDGAANANLPLSGEDQSSVIETFSEATDKNSVTHAHSVSSDNSAEADAIMQVEGVNNEDILHSDNGTMQDNVPHDTGCDGISEHVERAAADCSASGLSIEHTQIESDHPVAVNLETVNQVSGGLEGLATESTQSVAPNHTSGCIEDQGLTVEAESDSKNDAVVCAEPEISSLQTQVADEKEIPLVNSKHLSIIREDPSSDGKDRTFFYSEDSHAVKADITYGGVGVQPTNPQSSHRISLVTERSEFMETDIEELLDYKDEGTGIDAPDGKLGCLKNDEDTKIVKLDESSETDVVQEHVLSIGEPTQTVDRGIVTALDKDEVLRFEVEVGVKDSHAIATNIQFVAANTSTSSDKDLLEAETGTSAEHILVAEGENEVMDDKNTSNSVANVLDGDASNRDDEKLNRQHSGEWVGMEGAAAAMTASLGEHIETEISKEHVVETDGTTTVPSCDTSDDPNMSLLANEENLVGEMVGVSDVDRVARGDSPLGAEAGIYITACSRANSVDVEQYVEAKKQEVVEQQAETVIGMMDPGQNEGPVISTDVIPVSEVDVTAGSGSAFSGEGNSASCLPEENVHLSSNDLSPQDGERNLDSHTSTAINSDEPVNQGAEVEDESCKTSNEHNVHVPAAKVEFLDFQLEVEVDKLYPDGDQVDNSGVELRVDQHSSETNHSKISSDKTANPGSSLKLHQSGYLLPPENEGQFSVSDLVWGKVRSHPWWPGQIFDPADASEKAVKYFKKDCFLVAYFGDRTFAWNDASVLKPFRSYFSQIEKQSNSESFQNAVSSALAEVSRRVELGLTCSCIPQDVFGKLEYQIVENTGIREESSKHYSKDKSSGAASFEPDKLIDCVRELALSPFGRSDRLDVVIARAQLLAFCRYKGYRQPPEFLPGGELLENDTDLVDHEIKDEQNLSNKSSSQKRKHDLKDSLQPKKKERSLSELMGDMAYSPDDEDDSDGKSLGKPTLSSSGRKTKAVNSLADGSDKRISIYAAKVSTTTSTTPKPSFKIGECIRRVASQLTGSASCKSSSDQPGNDVAPQMNDSERGSIVIPTEFSSLNEMLLQLQLAAQNPREGHSFLKDAITFFSCFRNSVVSGRRPNLLGGRPGSGRKRKTSQAVGGTAEEFEFDDANDSYWTDRIVQNHSEEQLLQNGENDGREYQLPTLDPDRPLKSSRRSHSRKRYSSGNYEMEEPFEFIDRKMQKLSPAELILNFAEGSLPSEMNLNKIFRRFGPLKESETEVDHETRRARVVFKKGSDAEVAYSSAGVFNIFSSTLVTYQLSYSPSSSFKALPPAISPGQEEAT